MNFSKIFIATLTLFITTFSFSAANAFTEQLETASTEEVVKGGPRDVVQTKVDVTVYQPTATNLHISIINAEGTTQIEQTTRSQETTISTLGLEVGTYVLETVDDYGDYQEFVIEIKD